MSATRAVTGLYSRRAWNYRHVTILEEARGRVDANCLAGHMVMRMRCCDEPGNGGYYVAERPRTNDDKGRPLWQRLMARGPMPLARARLIRRRAR